MTLQQHLTFRLYITPTLITSARVIHRGILGWPAGILFRSWASLSWIKSLVGQRDIDLCVCVRVGGCVVRIISIWCPHNSGSLNNATKITGFTGAGTICSRNWLEQPFPWVHRQLFSFWDPQMFENVFFLPPFYQPHKDDVLHIVWAQPCALYLCTHGLF